MWAMNSRADINKNAVCRSSIKTKRIFFSCVLFAVSKAWALNSYIPAEDLTNVIETQTVEKANGPFGIEWINENRVIFSTPAYDKNTKERKGRGDINLYDINTGRTDSFYPGMVLCYAEDGWIQIDYSDSLQRVSHRFKRREGYFDGVLAPYEADTAHSDANAAIHFNPFSCRRYKGKDHEQIAGRFTLLLREDHGYLDLKDAADPTNWYTEPVIFVSADRKRRVPLPITGEDAASIHYYPFAKKYLLQRSSLAPSDRFARMDDKPFVTLLGIDGSVETVPVPEPIWRVAAGRHVDVYLTKPGLLWIISQWGEGLNAGMNAGYLERDGHLEKVIAGYLSPVLGVAVSPSGCRIAYRWGDGKPYGPGKPNDDNDVLKITNLCDADKK